MTRKVASSISRRLFVSATSQIFGRLFLSLARLVIAVVIVRLVGADRFGEYALLLTILFVSEWLVDFGLTDICVRNICQQPEQEISTLKALIIIKASQGVGVYALLIFVLYVMNYSEHLVMAGLIGGVGLFFYAGILVYRTIFKIRMQMERDVLGEILGVLVMVPIVLVVCLSSASIEALMGSYAISRAVFFFSAIKFGRKNVKLFPIRLDWPLTRTLMVQSAPLGITGLLVCIYDALAPIVLSKTLDMQSVAYYSFATRIVFPTILLIQALHSAFYPLLASYWKAEGVQFKKTQQAALEISFLASGALFCVVNGSAEYLMWLVDSSLVEHTYVLRIMSWAVLARAITTAMSPLIVIAGQQGKALWLTVIALLFHGVSLVVLVPVYGVLGAVVGYLVTEIFISMLPVVLLSQHVAKIKLDWRVIVKLCVAISLSVIIVRLIGSGGTLWGGPLALMIYISLAMVLGVLSMEKIRVINREIRHRDISSTAS